MQMLLLCSSCPYSTQEVFLPRNCYNFLHFLFPFLRENEEANPISDSFANMKRPSSSSDRVPSGRRKEGGVWCQEKKRTSESLLGLYISLQPPFDLLEGGWCVLFFHVAQPTHLRYFPGKKMTRKWARDSTLEGKQSCNEGKALANSIPPRKGRNHVWWLVGKGGSHIFSIKNTM